MKKTILLLLSVILFTEIYAQQDSVVYLHERNSEFGVNAGFTTGIGMSYRHWFDDIGVQITALPVKSYSYSFISVGVTGMYSLYRNRYVRAFLYFGNHYYTDGLNNMDFNYNVGFGPGFSFGKVVAFNIQFCYAMYNVGRSDYLLMPGAEIGLYYKF